jgi:hypothetical protein
MTTASTNRVDGQGFDLADEANDLGDVDAAER